MKKEININNDNVLIDKLPERCPFCHELVTPEIKGSNFNTSATDTHKDLIILELFVVCSNSFCQKSFIGYYNMIGNNEFGFINTSKGESKKRAFSTTINSISNKFSKIYNQAYTAEQNELFEICGMGYRKALEFLLKDYCIAKFSTDKIKIEKMYISDLLEEFIHDDVIKQVSIRAFWLGNDETHYIRLNEKYGLKDLKDFINSIVDIIEANELYNRVIIEMPNNK